MEKKLRFFKQESFQENHENTFIFSGSYLSDGEAIKPLIVNESELLQKSRKFLDALGKKYALNFQARG